MLGWALTKVAALSLLLVLFGFGAHALEAQTYQINSATYGSNGLTAVPAGINGALLTLTGALPSAAQQAASPLLACFYTGSGSTAGFTLSAPNGAGTEPLTVPASTIQSIPQGQFTAANGYSVPALVYFISGGSGVCDGTFDAQLTNQYPVQVVAPSLGAYTGPVSVPQTNSAINLRAAPLSLNIPASGFLTSALAGGATSVGFGSFGNVTLAVPATATSSVNVPVPASFSSSAVGTTASLSICNSFSGVDTPICTTPTPAITLTITALASSAGTVTATPNPAVTSGEVVLSAQFTKAATAGNGVALGAPSGLVTFVADGAPLPPAPLVLDTTATFTSQPTMVTTPTAATPMIAPAAGSFTSAQTITITDTPSGATIYYTQDGSTPTTASTLYTAPFVISTSQTISAIAVLAGSLNSAVATVAYVVNVHPATQLAFQVQPVTTPAGSPITPGVQVAVEDATGAVVTSSTAPVTLAIGANPGQATLGGTLTVNAVSGIATFSNLTFDKVNPVGTANTLSASSGTLTGVLSAGFNITPPPITMTVQSELVGINSTLTGGFTLGAPAPVGGVTVTLRSLTPANVTINPGTVTVAAGQTTGAFTYSGVAAGDSTLKATAPGYQSGSTLTTATAAQVSLGAIPNVAPAQMQSLALSLPTAAPPGGTTVTFTIANTNIATVTQSVTVPAGAQTSTANPQVTGVLIGTTTVTASAPGYAPVSVPVVVTVTAAFNPGTTYINLAPATNTSLMISAPAPPGGIVFTLSSDNPMVASVPSTITVVAGATSVPIAITGVSAGSTTIRADSAGITEATGTVNVDSTIANQTLLTGYDLQETTGLYLPVGPSVPTTVTVTVTDPTVAVITTDRTVAGQTTLTFPNITSDYIGGIGVQGLRIGTTTITVSAPGYTNGTVTVTVNPSGFVIDSNQLSFSTTTYSQPTNRTVYPAILNPDLSYYDTSTLNPQSATISVPVTSSSPAIGTVTSPLAFPALYGSQTTSFQPVAVGTTNITLGAPPAGFNVSTSYQQSVATVTTPAITVYNQTTAVDLTNTIGLDLSVPPPTGQPVTVTLTSSDPTIFTVSNSRTVVGTASTTFPNTSSEYPGTLFIQGQNAGTATLTMSAPGYTSGTSTITVHRTGFFFNYYGCCNLNTTTFSGPYGVSVQVAGVDANANLSEENLGINPGATPITVSFANSTPATGTVSASSVTFHPGESAENFNFLPAAAGTSTLTLTNPSGFTAPVQNQTIAATVTAPTMYTYNPETGVKLQNNFYLGIPVSTPMPETVTVTSSNPAIALLSTSETTTGTASITFTTTNGSGQSIWVQGQGVGTATLTVSAPGYNSSTGTITVYASGFAFASNYSYYTPPYTTTTFSGLSTLNVDTVEIGTDGSVRNFNLPLNPGVTATVVVTDSTPSVGTISSAALVFNPSDTNHTFTFQPVSAGTTNVSISTPVGYTTPVSGNPSMPQYQSGVITVTAPVIQINNITTGVNLDGSMNIYLPQTPPSNGGNGVTVTVTSSSPSLATLSTDPTVIGTSAVVFTNVTSQYVGTIYVQGQALGTAQLTESAPGYTNGSSTVTVNPSGFLFYYGGPPFTAYISNGERDLSVYTAVLAPGTLTLQQVQLPLNPGLSSVSIPVSSSNTAVGTYTPNPLVIMPGQGSVTGSFIPLTVGTTTVSVGTVTGFSTPSQYTSGTVTVQP